MQANKFITIGRLTRDPELKQTRGGGQLVAFGFATEGTKHKDSSGQWVEEPCFLDCKAFDRGEFKLATWLSELRKGSHVYLEGKLTLEQWNAQDGSKRSKHVLMVEQFRKLEKQAAPQRQEQPAEVVDKDIPF